MLTVIPVSLKTANGFVSQYHRHHKPVVNHKFSIGCIDEDGVLHGVAICGRPVARYLDNGYVLEVNRLCTDGTYNACSILYAACARAAKDLGYRKIITYILESECGSSLKASGWVCEGEAGNLEWGGRSKPKDPNQYPHEMKTRWARTFGEWEGGNYNMYNKDFEEKTVDGQMNFFTGGFEDDSREPV